MERKLSNLHQEYKAEIMFEDETDDVKIKGMKFYTMNDGRGAIRQIGEIALGKAFEGLSVKRSS